MSMAAKDFLFDLHLRDFFRYIMFMLSATSFSLIYDYMSYSCINTGQECKIKFMETYPGFQKKHTYLDGIAKLFMFLTELLCLGHVVRTDQAGCQHVLSVHDPSDHLININNAIHVKHLEKYKNNNIHPHTPNNHN